MNVGVGLVRAEGSGVEGVGVLLGLVTRNGPSDLELRNLGVSSLGV